MRAIKILTELFNKKIWTISDFILLSAIFALNPFVIVGIEFLFGVQFLTGLVAGWIILFAIKTQWRKE